MHTKSIVLTGIFAAMILTWLAVPAEAQRIKHSLGNFGYEMDHRAIWNTSSQPDFYGMGLWPADYARYGNVAFHWNAYSVGSFINADGVEITNETQVWKAGFREPPERGLVDYRRVQPPETLLQKSDGTMLIATPPFNGVVDPGLPSDQMIWHRYKMSSSPGMEVLKRAYSFTNKDHADYIIQHNQYVLTFDTGALPFAPVGMDTTQIVRGVYFTIAYAFTNIGTTNMNQTVWYSQSQGDWSEQETVPSRLVSGNRPLLVAYGWNGAHPDHKTFDVGGREFDNTGSPRYAWAPGSSFMPTAEFTGTTYAGFTTLHVDAKGSGDLTQMPHSVKLDANIQNVWDRNFSGFATWADWAASGQKGKRENIPGYPNNPGVTQGNMIFKSYGPFDLAYGDTVNIVYALGVGGISREMAEQKGKEWLAWYRGESGADFDDQAKNQLISTGRDSLIRTLDHANWAWHNNLNVSNAKPSPNLIIREGPNMISLEWDDMVLRYNDVVKYRIWRKRGTFLQDTQDELTAILRQRSDGKLWPDGERIKWQVIDEVPASQTSYEDRTAVRGEPYYYGVTVVDNGSNTTGLFPGRPLESSKFSNRSQLPAFAFEPGEGSTANIRIVPNPYFVSAGDYNFSDETNKLLFVNLPPFCEIRIFTAMGDLVKTINHSAGTADNQWDQVTDFNQLAASGVYILHVSKARDIDGNALPDAINKFVIVR